MKLHLKEKLYYNIGEVSKAFNVNTSLLRFWEKEFQELNPKKKSNGIRKYTNTDIEILKKIYHLLKEKKLTIEGAKVNMSNQKDNLDKYIAIKSKLENIKDELKKIKSKL
ncbi:MAG: MerR family transcriptional regulator [Flavobacteriaceae bacterium]